MRTNDETRDVAIGGLLALAIAMGIGRFVYTPLLPAMASAEGLGASEAGLIASSNYVGYLLGALLALTSAMGGPRRRWLLVALAASVVTTAAMAFAEGFVAFLGVRLLGGIASAWVMVFASAIVLERAAEAGRGALGAVHFAGVGTGIALASLLVTLVFGAGGGWRAAWLCNGVVGAALAVLVARLLVDREPPSSPGAAPGPGPNRGAAFGGLLVGYALFGFGYVVTATFIVQLVRSAGLSLQAETLVWALVGVTAAPSVALWNRVARRVGPGTAMAAACALEAVGVVASVSGGGLGALALAAVLLGGTFVGVTYLGLAEARLRWSGEPRRAVAAMTAAFGAGQIVGPGLAGTLRDRTGTFLWPTLLAALALLLAAALIHATRVHATSASASDRVTPR